MGAGQLFKVDMGPLGCRIIGMKMSLTTGPGFYQFGGVEGIHKGADLGFNHLGFDVGLGGGCDVEFEGECGSWHGRCVW